MTLTRWQRVRGWILHAIALWYAAGVLWLWVGWILGVPAPHRVSAGDECGPNHRWVYFTTNAAGGDLSCEPHTR
jgi:uncharacterized membrane protein